MKTNAPALNRSKATKLNGPHLTSEIMAQVLVTLLEEVESNPKLQRKLASVIDAHRPALASKSAARQRKAPLPDPIKAAMQGDEADFRRAYQNADPRTLRTIALQTGVAVASDLPRAMTADGIMGVMWRNARRRIEDRTGV